MDDDQPSFLRRAAEWTHRRLGVPYRLHVEDSGGDGPVIILLHGIASSSVAWGFFTPLLQSQYHCISIDLLGFGESPKPAWSSYTPDQHIKQIHYTITRLGLRQPYIIAGHSLGGLLALRYARRYEYEVQQVLMFSPPVYADPSSVGVRRVRLATNFYLKAYKYIREHKNFTIANAARLARLTPIQGSFSIDEATWLPFTRTLEECIEHQTVIDDVRDLPMPVDIFYGTFDEFIIRSHISSLAELPHVRVHRFAARHVLTKRYAQTVIKILTDLTTKAA